METTSKEVSDSELKGVIADFLEMGHAENIVAMFRRDSRYYGWAGELLQDERINVRLGVAVLFEELKEIQPDKLPLAIPSLIELLGVEEPLFRGEALSILGIIGDAECEQHIRRHQNDPDPQVRELVRLVLEDFC